MRKPLRALVAGVFVLAATSLETPVAAAEVNATVTGDAATHALTVTLASTAGDTINVFCSNGRVALAAGNATALVAPATNCADVRTLNIAGDSAGNTVMVDGVTAASFSALTGGTIDGGGGDDQIQIGGGRWTVKGGAGADQLLVDGSAGIALDGEDGNDGYTITFGGAPTPYEAWTGAITISDSGAATDFDSLAYSDCSSTPTGLPPTAFTNHGQTLGLSGLELTTCTLPPTPVFPACDATHTTYCYSGLTLDGDAAPASLELAAEVRVGLLQLHVSDGTLSTPSDLLSAKAAGGASPYSLSSRIGFTLNVGTNNPGVLLGTGKVRSFGYTTGADGNTITAVVSPVAYSLATGACFVSQCDVGAASFDRAGTISMAVHQPVVQPNLSGEELAWQQQWISDSNGSYIATDAQAFSTPSFDPETNSFEFQLAAPHLTTASAVNTGFFDAFIPDAMLTNEFGITDLSTVTTQLALEETSGGVTTTVTPTVTRVTNPDGVVVSLDGFHYSNPAFALRKATSTSPGGSTGGGSTGGGSAGVGVSTVSAPAAPAVTDHASTSAFAGAGTLSVATDATAPTTTVGWGAGTFAAPVTVSVSIADKTTLGMPVGFAVDGLVVEVAVTAADGSAVTSFSAPLDLAFANAPAGFVPVYTEEGGAWRAIPQLQGTSLPDGQADGWYRDGTTVHVLTRHATYFGLVQSLDLRWGVRRTLQLRRGDATLVVYAGPSLASTVQLTLSRRGRQVASWTRRVAAGNTTPLRLSLPRAARKPGAYVLQVRATAGPQSLARLARLRFR